MTDKLTPAEVEALRWQISLEQSSGAGCVALVAVVGVILTGIFVLAAVL